MGLRFSRSAAVTLYLVGVVFAGRALAWQDEHPQAPPQVLRYSVATLAPLDVTVPAAVLRNGTLHAMLVELAAGSSRNDVRGRLGVSDEELEALPPDRNGRVGSAGRRRRVGTAGTGSG